jgi:hypothetical protein
MSDRHTKGKTDHPEKEMVVFFAYAIIEPFTVVVKAIDAAIAHATVFGLIRHHCITDTTM